MQRINDMVHKGHAVTAHYDGAVWVSHVRPLGEHFAKRVGCAHSQDEALRLAIDYLDAPWQTFNQEE